MVAATEFIDRAAHWDRAYTRRGDSVSWFQVAPTTSLELLEGLDLARDAAIIDVGGGASRLVEGLCELGFTALSVLDVSTAALDAARQRTESSDSITWIHQDLLTWQPTQRYDVWHDRALLHFFVEEQDRGAYLKTLRRAIEPGGWVVLGTFADDGPETCSGLPVARYSLEELPSLLGDDFTISEHRREEHVTPDGVRQPFSWIVARRTAPG
jgi:SAM-dependent methyltransferase